MENINVCHTMNNGLKIPCLGFGTYKAADGKSTEIIRMAIETGYRYFDTASFYETEEFLGAAIKESGIPREEFFIASKLWKNEMGYDNAKKAFARTLENIGTDYLDLYLIHWPKPTPDTPDWRELDRETWRALEELYKEGKVKAIGLSNFLPHHIENILEVCEIKPMADQLEFHPGYTQEAAIRYCQEQEILVQAWSPIGRGRVLEDAMLTEMAAKYHISTAQLCLRYAVERGVVPLVKSSSAERMKQNQDIFSFELTKEDRYRIDTMPQTGWSGEHPDRERVNPQ